MEARTQPAALAQCELSRAHEPCSQQLPIQFMDVPFPFPTVPTRNLLVLYFFIL